MDGGEDVVSLFTLLKRTKCLKEGFLCRRGWFSGPHGRGSATGVPRRCRSCEVIPFSLWQA